MVRLRRKRTYYAVYDRGDIFEVHGFDSAQERLLWVLQHPERDDTRMPFLYGVGVSRAGKMAGSNPYSKKFEAAVIWHHKESEE
jgi:hypothetical protein